MTSRPHWNAASAFLPSTAGMSLSPIGETPSISKAVAMVLAVNCPPQAPAPGQAWFSISRSSPASMRPALWAPMASNTSWIVILRPRCSPYWIEPL